ncbi:dipeptide ABC transporter ATP-binding protein [Aestuariivirga sp. YIM B02566]|uniref:ABC transporter ATP-binding protein n=1 Tax=Taklimakanibacter albus TaxID=2800327 RepID=A0ACC5R634_9HYPH|nr:ABC transporter ATP-binding protein [Aestuariivirga sp. YIM B02566]MBK1868008.1 ABC transporter ATP-binding protein [Aestuariivirga sp. YIM B02566]
MARLLEVKDLTVRFGETTAVRNVSLRVDQGEVLGIVGESGSGKSVTCRAFMRLLPPSAAVTGDVSFDGQSISAMSTQDLRRIRGRDIGMIFQNPASHLDPLLRIGAQIAEPIRRHLATGQAAANAQAVDLLRQVGITEPTQRAQAYPHEFSGGMKQRAMIATAIGCGPKLLIADEPTTALDVTVQARILDLLRHLNRNNGLSIVLISHDLGVIAQNCSRIIVMRQGEIVEQGSTREIIEAPKHPYTRLLLDSQPSRSKASSSLISSGSTRPLLTVKNLTVTFPKRRDLVSRFTGKDTEPFRALDRVSLTVEAGETVGIVGESGSGKSTLARAIVRLVTPAAGEIVFDGKEASTDGAFRRAVQMVFQNPYDSLNPRLKVKEAIAEPIRRHRLAEGAEIARRVDDLADKVELPRALLERYPSQLSGGQCQRAGLARALAVEPRFLIADEITSALDVTTQAQILKLLDRLRRERGLTMLYVSHDLSVVSAFCQRVYVFKAGRIVEEGPAAKVMREPADAYTRELVRSIPRLDAIED